MTEHEPWCCRSPRSECAQAGGCSSGCNCGAPGPADRDECRPVTLPSGETLPVLGGREPDAREVAALGDVVDAARRLMPDPDPGAPELWGRVDAARVREVLFLREIGWQAGVRASVLFRLRQGRMPGAQDLAAIEAWLINCERKA